MMFVLDLPEGQARARRGWAMTGGNSVCPFGCGVAEAAGAAPAEAGGKFITFLNQGPLADAAAAPRPHFRPLATPLCFIRSILSSAVHLRRRLTLAHPTALPTLLSDA